MATHTEPAVSVPFDPHTFGRLVQAYHRIDRSEVTQAWHLLEALHVLGQTRLLPHTHTHWLMLGLAWRTRDLTEWSGQLFRLLLVPLGNNGRARVSAFKPMAVPPDLMATLRQYLSSRP